MCVFEECCSLAQIGTQGDVANQLAPQAQFRPRAFEKCSALRQISLEKAEYDPTNLTRCLPECCFLEAGIVSLRLPPDFNWIGPAACELCKRLQLVDLSRTIISEILGSTFAHCSQLERLSLANKLRRIGREAFLNCASLREVDTPPALLYVARRAFAGCTQLCAFHKPEAKTTWRGPYRGAILAPCVFESCLALTHIELPQDTSHPSRSATERCIPDGCLNSSGLELLKPPSEWINMLPPDGEDSQAFNPIAGWHLSVSPAGRSSRIVQRDRLVRQIPGGRLSVCPG